MTKLVIFDFDGTLADSFPFFMQVFNTLADTHGFRRVGEDELEALRGMEAGAIMRHVGLPLWKFPRVGMQFKAMMAAEISRIPLFDGVPQMLQALHDGGMSLAIVSSNSEENVRGVLGASAGCIACYTCGASLLGKRHHLRDLRRTTGFAAREMLYIGDELRDQEAADAEGIAFGAVTWGYTRPDALRARSPAFVFERVADIPALLLPQ